MKDFSKMWNTSNANQASHIAFPIGNYDDKRSQTRIPIGKKPDLYKSINSSSINVFENNLKKTEHY